MSKKATLYALRRAAHRLAEAFALGSFRIEADRRNARRYGACFRDGVIRIRLVDRRNGRPLAESSLIDTLCHELAHLRHFNHGPGFKAFYLSLLRHAREQGMYRPASRRRAEALARQKTPVQKPEQLSLFPAERL